MFELHGNKIVTRDEIEEYSRASGCYLVEVLKEGNIDLDVMQAAFVQWRYEKKSHIAMFNIFDYCKLAHWDLPDGFVELASNSDAFALYFEKLTDYFIQYAK